MDAVAHRKIFKRLKRADPLPTTELEYASPFELLIAVMLSAQATDKSVNKATAQLFEAASTPEAIVKLGLRGLKRYIKTIGLYNTKAKNILKTSKLLLKDHGSRVPNARAALEALPGVGRKTANVILNTAFGYATIAVDTHIFRVANRTGLAPGKNVRQVEDKLLRVVPPVYRRHAHHWLILHGRYTCTARKPHCERCIIYDLCEYHDKVPVHSTRSVPSQRKRRSKR
jgi:endonuclease III